jgi:hypothetical protein
VAQLKAAYGSGIAFNPGSDGIQFQISLPKGTLKGYVSGAEDSDTVHSFYAGTICGE